jgi:hypothetical protein
MKRKKLAADTEVVALDSSQERSSESTQEEEEHMQHKVHITLVLLLLRNLQDFSCSCHLHAYSRFAHQSNGLFHRNAPIRKAQGARM